MARKRGQWAIVLAGGSGLRLQSLTTGRDGTPVPKQYCSLNGDRTLLGDAVGRAGRIVEPDRVVAVVAAEHRRFWESELGSLASDHVVVQPQNRGTAAGILLPLLSILSRDQSALVALLPSDHHVENEAVLAASLRLAMQLVARDSTRILLLGIHPEFASSDYGWIVPVAGAARRRAVGRFVEKPEPDIARRLMRSGALWNSFLMVGSARALVTLYARRMPALLCALADAWARPLSERDGAIEALYGALPSADFSRDLLQGSEDWLDVLEVPPCGWTDLGTPDRVAKCLLESDGRPARGPLPRREVLVLRAAIGALDATTATRVTRGSR